MRLQKYLAECGIGSRRKCEEYITMGLVSVNHKIITELGTKVESTDVVEFKGKLVKAEDKTVYFMLNKPVGYVTTAKDEKGRQTVLELMENVTERIFPVGRLDFLTSGLLILTNDGELTYGLTHPKHHVDKTYEVRVQGQVSNESIQRLRSGVVIDNHMTYPAKVRILKKQTHTTSLEIIIHEGRNRQVRKMCEAVGHKVLELRRVAVGKLELGQLQMGAYRSLSVEEINYLKSVAKVE